MAPELPNFSLRRARAADFDALFLIHRAAMGEYIAGTWGWDESWQLEHFRTSFRPEARSVIELQSQTIGFADIIERQDCFYLENIEIEPHYQSCGIGTRIIQNLIERARLKGVPLRLQVLKVNTRARALYDRLGFRRVGKTDTHFVMERREPLTNRIPDG
jgi:ribosomal protein S18 acetylase RimI-like enzyme